MCPSPSVSRYRRWLKARRGQTSYYIGQAPGSRWEGIAVGSSFIEAGADCLNFWIWNRDKLSAKVFLTPGICLALKRILFRKQTKTNLRTKNINDLSRHDLGRQCRLGATRWFCSGCAANKTIAPNASSPRTSTSPYFDARNENSRRKNANSDRELPSLAPFHHISWALALHGDISKCISPQKYETPAPSFLCAKS